MKRAIPAAIGLLLAACSGSESDGGQGARVAPEDLRVGPPPVVSRSTETVVPAAGFGHAVVELPGGKKIKVETAKTPGQRQKGLMFRTELANDAGMLFYFGRQTVQTFWMKNTFIDLDMVFLGGDKKITVIHADVPRSMKDTPDQHVARRAGSAKYVLELPAGAAERFGLVSGQELRFDD